MKKLVLSVLIAVLCFVAASAQDEIASDSGNALRNAVPSERQAYLNGIFPETAEDVTDSFDRLLDNMSADGKGALRSAFVSLTRIAAVILLTAAARGFSAAGGGEADAMIEMAGTLGCAAVLFGDFAGILALCRNTLEQIGLFSATLQPVLATVLATGGSVATATTLQMVSMVVFDMVIRLVSKLLAPAACAYLAIVTVDAATGGEMLRGAADCIRSLTAGALKLSLTLFTAYLAVAGGVAGTVDRMTLKTAKFAVSGAVPVVGGVISDATETMLSGAMLLKSSIGVFGMVCVTAICFVPFLQAGASYLCYKVGAAVLSPLCSNGLQRFLERVGAGFGLLLGMLSTCCIILYLELVYVIAMVKPI
jgi:stage III sporulation protein AE